MTEKDKEIQELRRDLQWLLQSETIREIFVKDSRGFHKYDIKGLDRTIKNLHDLAREAEQKRAAAESECVQLRRQIEAILTKLEETENAPSHAEESNREA